MSCISQVSTHGTLFPYDLYPFRSTLRAALLYAPRFTGVLRIFEPHQSNSMRRNSRQVMLLLGWATLLGFPLLAWILNHFVRWFDPAELFQTRIGHYGLELGIGASYGLFAGLIAWRVATIPPVRQSLAPYIDLIRSLQLRTSDILFISLCAGIGEEIFFRGFLQEGLGIWWTALVFIAIHGYLRPTSWQISIYGISMVVLIAGVGYLREYVGLVSAIAAHTVIDIVLFVKSLYTPPPTVHSTHRETNDEFFDESLW